MNKTLNVRYTGCSATALPYICNRDEGAVYVGVATENAGSISAPDVQTDTSVNALKIYATRPFDLNVLADEFADNEFLDRINPMLGYTRGVTHYVLRNTLKYDDIHLGGDFYIPPGTYNLYIRKTGATEDGGNNVTLTLG